MNRSEIMLLTISGVFMPGNSASSVCLTKINAMLKGAGGMLELIVKPQNF